MGRSPWPWPFSFSAVMYAPNLMAQSSFSPQVLRTFSISRAERSIASSLSTICINFSTEWLRSSSIVFCLCSCCRSSISRARFPRMRWRSQLTQTISFKNRRCPGLFNKRYAYFIEILITFLYPPDSGFPVRYQDIFYHFYCLTFFKAVKCINTHAGITYVDGRPDVCFLGRSGIWTELESSNAHSAGTNSLFLPL